MKILVISQDFYPDSVAVAQILSDLCFSLSERGHEVKVVSSQYPYEGKKVKYSSNENVNNVIIRRIWSTGFGKKNISLRLMDFFTFNFSILIHLIFIKKKSYDLIIGLTSPPLLSFLGAQITKKKSIKFCYLIMDMQPELSIQSGLIKKNSLVARILIRLGKSIQCNSDKIIVLDRFMKNYLVEKNNIPFEKIAIAPAWPVVDNLYSGSRMENPFRIENNFGDRIVIMYSGNHSYVHPINTILELARELENDERFLFVFIGNGVRKQEVTDFKEKYRLENIIQLPFQPRDKIYLSLGSSDIQVVIIGEGLVGFTHPCKIYGALYVGKPIIYIGPLPSHVSEILSGLTGNIMVNHGEIDELRSKLLDLCADFCKIEDIGCKNKELAQEKFIPGKMINEMCSIIENITTQSK